MPDGWTVIDAADGWATTTDLRWPGLALVAGEPVERSPVLRAPAGAALGDASALTATFSWRLDIAAGQPGEPDITVPGPVQSVLVAPKLIVESVTIGQVPAVGEDATYLDPGEPVPAQPRFEVFRVRFVVSNPDALDVGWVPQIAFSSADVAGLVKVPEKASRAGSPFYAATEWIRVPGPSGGTPPGRPGGSPPGAEMASENARGLGAPDRLSEPGPDGVRPPEDGRWGGTLPGADREVIPPGQTRIRARDGVRSDQAEGLRSMGINPMPAMTLPADGFVEVEYSLRATIDADYLATYQLQLTDGGVVLPGAPEASVTIEAEPTLELSPGQRAGIPADAIEPLGAVAGVAYPLQLPAGGSADGPAGQTATALPDEQAPSGPVLQYELLPPDTIDGVVQPLADETFVSPHTSYVLGTDACSACHRTHEAADGLLLTAATSQSTLCLGCHDGSGSNIDVQAQYTDESLPPNDEANRVYYQHDALLAPSGDSSGRRSECIDCHNAHNAVPVDSVETGTGWTVSGRQGSVAGVAVTNGAAGSKPAYRYLAASYDSMPTREYELCFTCHSSFTTLPSNDGQPASRWWLDKGIELNPANLAFHPVEAPGRNATPAMAAGLLGTSPYKQWDFTPGSTVRCVNCHADSRSFDAEAEPPTAGSSLENHASLERGILRQPYRDGRYVGATPTVGEGLKPANEPYSATDFALCYMCHAEAPFVNANPDDLSQTNFGWHGYHLRLIENEGNGGLDIDTDGAGQGNAICAECHFRIHSNALAVREGDRDNERLVNFAPNVQAYQNVNDPADPRNGTLEWAAQPGGGATCTLTCHGESHGAEGYPKP